MSATITVKLFVVSCMVLVVFVPLFSSAAGLVPECSNPGLPAGACDLCDFFKLTQNVIDFLTKVVGPVLVMLMVIWGGLVLLTAGGTDRVKKGKEIIWTAFVGYFIVLVSWLVINEIMHFFANDSLHGWSSISC